MKKSLTKQLEEAQYKLQYLEDRRMDAMRRAEKAEEELKQRNMRDMNFVGDQYQREREKSDVLLEVLRWLINPETTKDPFNQIEAGKNAMRLH